MCIKPVQTSSSLFLASSDTDISLLSLSSSLTRRLPTPVQEDKPDVVRLSDEDSEAEAWMLEGQQSEYSRCSYEQFGVCRQQVFVCRTCRDQYDRLLQAFHPEWTREQIQQQCDIVVLCEQCAHFCHTNKGHDVVAIGVKNHVACDCGNALFRRLDQLALLTDPSLRASVHDASDVPSLHGCVLCPEKECLNASECYNHNMRERWCYCDGPEELPMVQCVKCCDWFHERCAREKYRSCHGVDLDLEDEKVDFMCKDCEERAKNDGIEKVEEVPVVKESSCEKEEEKEESLESKIRVEARKRH